MVRNKSAASCESTTFWPLSWQISLSIRVQNTLNHCRFVYLYFIFTHIYKSSIQCGKTPASWKAAAVCLLHKGWIAFRPKHLTTKHQTTLPVFFYLVLSSFSRKVHLKFYCGHGRWCGICLREPGSRWFFKLTFVFWTKSLMTMVIMFLSLLCISWKNKWRYCSFCH